METFYQVQFSYIFNYTMYLIAKFMYAVNWKMRSVLNSSFTWN